MVDLLELAERIEAGEDGRLIHLHIWELLKRPEAIPTPFLTSLDAAKALHDAVLPKGWRIDIQFCAGRWFVITSNDIYLGPAKGWGKQGSGEHKTNPAAAWVAAILRAKAQEE